MPPRINPTWIRSSPLAKRSSQCLSNARPFSGSPHHCTRLRRSMFRWLRGPGENFRRPFPGSTNYLSGYDSQGQLWRSLENAPSRSLGEEASDPSEESNLDSEGNPRQSKAAPEDKADLRPFPINSGFISQPVLSEELREEIYDRVISGGKSVKIVSAELGIDMNRVGAVVRLKAIEKDWVKKNKPLAKPYSKAVLEMLPTTPLMTFPLRPKMHEPINDLPVHPATTQQIFEPTSESRSFTRIDASKAFDPELLPTDERIPHPELIELEKERLLGIPQEERIERQRERAKRESEKREAKDRRRKEIEEATLKRVLSAESGGNGGRWEWRFREISVQDAGKDGRAPGGVGWRYGIPHEDRKKGQVKIPTRV
ncbi:hypothetical protein FGG08_001263 [Glutinoglossum americanum]|uniref:Uncharacterized protein n=1 Tax=Glutinoglossum americanum TaxID=1670608 RepID=A0A9P8IH40_9PEZI|nr:hypothetical protein FGG08_001263 [Glutinoglossum americanum]